MRVLGIRSMGISAVIGDRGHLYECYTRYLASALVMISRDNKNTRMAPNLAYHLSKSSDASSVQPKYYLSTKYMYFPRDDKHNHR